MKTLWEKEKKLVTSIFSFFHNVYNPVKDKVNIWSTFIFSSAIAFNLERSNILLFGKELSHILWQLQFH